MRPPLTRLTHTVPAGLTPASAAKQIGVTVQAARWAINHGKLTAIPAWHYYETLGDPPTTYRRLGIVLDPVEVAEYAARRAAKQGTAQ